MMSMAFIAVLWIIISFQNYFCVVPQVKLNLHGVVAVESAQQIEEEEYEETVKVYEAATTKVSSYGIIACISSNWCCDLLEKMEQKFQQLLGMQWKDLGHLLLQYRRDIFAEDMSPRVYERGHLVLGEEG